MAETYQVIITEKAEASLEKIVTYLLENVSYDVAEKVRSGILESIYSLAKNPSSNGVAKDLIVEKIVYRRIWKWSYRIIFRIIEDKLEVLVVQIHHAKEDPEKVKNSIDI